MGAHGDNCVLYVPLIVMVGVFYTVTSPYWIVRAISKRRKRGRDKKVQSVLNEITVAEVVHSNEIAIAEVVRAELVATEVVRAEVVRAEVVPAEVVRVV